MMFKREDFIVKNYDKLKLEKIIKNSKKPKVILLTEFQKDNIYYYCTNTN